MGLYPIPQIASMGVVTDQDATQTALQAFSFATNARFQDSKVTRGPVFSAYGMMTTSPRCLLAYQDANGVDHFLVQDSYGSIFEESSNGQVDVSPTSGFTPQDAYTSVTSTTLTDVIYFNRPDSTPLYRDATSSDHFQTLDSYDSGWKDTENSAATAPLPANVRFNSLRSYNSMLIGINVNIGSTPSPNMVYWSDYAITDRQPPLNWNVGSTESSSGQNILSEMKGTLIDGIKLGQFFLLLGSKETFKMEANGNTTSIFNFTRLFDSGVMSVNCAVEHDNLLYVFGDRDIYTTDGTNRSSIAMGRVRNFIFENISNTNRDKSFVFHNQGLNEVLFCFVSNDPYCKFVASSDNLGCNRAAVFNYLSGCWYFYDLPYVTAATLINTYTGLTWDQAQSGGILWAQITGSWAGLQDGATDVTTFASNSSVAPYASPAALRTYAIYEESVAAGTIDMFANQPCYMVKASFDCGDLSQIPQVSARLRDYKLLSTIWVKGILYDDASAVTFTVGTADQGSINPTYGTGMQWTQDTSKLDYNQAGRYLSFTVEYDDYKSFRLDGLDLDLTVLGGYGK